MNTHHLKTIGSRFVLFALLASVALSQNSGAIQGTVYAVPNGTVQNSVVIACVVVNDECSATLSKVGVVQGSGASGKYLLENLGTASYLMLAWRDLNGSSDVDAGDEVGVYAKNGQPALVKSPAAGIDLRLKPFTGDMDALLSSAEVVSSPPLAAQPSKTLVGDWSTIDFMSSTNNSDTGRYLGSNNSFTTAKFDATGKYELTEYIYITTSYGCSNWIFTTTGGAYSVSNGQLAFAPKTSNQIYQSGCRPANSYKRKNDPSNLKAFNYWWKLEADGDGRETLSLLPSSKTDWFYADHLHRAKK